MEYKHEWIERRRNGEEGCLFIYVTYWMPWVSVNVVRTQHPRPTLFVWACSTFVRQYLVNTDVVSILFVSRISNHQDGGHYKWITSLAPKGCRLYFASAYGIPWNLSISLVVCTNIMETWHPRMTYSVTHLRGFRNELLVSPLRVRSIHVGVRILNTFCFYYVRCWLSFTCLKYFVSMSHSSQRVNWF